MKLIIFRFYNLLFFFTIQQSSSFNDNIEWNNVNQFSYKSLLKSLVNVNEARMKSLNSMVHLNDYHLGSILMKKILRESSAPHNTIYLVSNLISGKINVKPVNYNGNNLGFRDAKDKLLIVLYPRLSSVFSVKSNREIEPPEDMKVQKSVGDIVYSIFLEYIYAFKRFPQLNCVWKTFILKLHKIILLGRNVSNCDKFYI
ncbi:unnamed protein product [Leptidea sinapis]|uniref:Uncharacterized protein n=1 Tax=Leptidea sinapis TaxID=189913 RepID=A0A5E4QLZ6_9NEOP|nr:unnamed protein product [Leptidea sinapis]